MKRFLAAILTVGLLLTGCSSENSSAPPPTQRQVEVKKVTDLGVTPEEFRTKFNARAVEIGTAPLSIISFTIRNGDTQDIFQYNYSPRLMLQLNVDKTNGKINDVCLFSQPQLETLESDGMMTLAIYSHIIVTLNPNMNQDEVYNLMEKLKLYRVEELQNGNGEVTINDITYTSLWIPNKGVLMLILSAKDSILQATLPYLQTKWQNE